MADGFGYGGSSRPYPYWPSPHPPASAPSFVADRSVESYDPIEGMSFPTSSYNQSPADWSYNPGYHQYLQPRSSSSSIYASNNSRSDTYGFRGEDYYEDMFSPGGLVTSRESSSGCVSAVHPNENLPERKHTDFEPTYNSGTLIPESSLAEEQTILHNIEPVNFDMLLGLLATEGPEHHSRYSNFPPSSQPVECDIKSSGSLLSDKPEGSGHFLRCPRPKALFGDNGNDGFGIPLKNASEAIKSDENNAWDYLMLSSLEGPSTQGLLSMERKSCGAVKTENLNDQSLFSQKTCFSGPTNRHNEDVVQATQEPSIPQEPSILNGNKRATFLTDLRPTERREDTDDVLTGSPKRHLIDLGDFSSPASSPRISSVVNAMHNLSELLVYECFNNGSLLKLEQLESLEKVVNNLSKCLQKITGNQSKPEEASNAKQPVHLSCSGIPILHEVPKVVNTNLQGPHVKPQERRDSCHLAEVLDKNEMTQSIKNILASNFPDDDKEQQPQTLLFKNLWLEAEAALCSTTYMARFQRIRNEIGNQELQNQDFSADASPSVQEVSHKPQKSVHMMNNTEQETTESVIENPITHENNVVTANQVPQSSDFNSDSMDALIEFISKSFTELSEQKTDATSGNKLNTEHQESPKSTTTSNNTPNIIERFQILQQQEANRGRNALNPLKINLDTLDSDKTVQSKDTGNSDQPIHDSQVNLEASLMSTGSSEVNDVMRRLMILKRRDAETDNQKPETGLELESKMDSDNVVEPRFRQEVMVSPCPYIPWVDQVVSGSGPDELNSLNETEVHGRGDESLTSDWEHVVKDEVVAGEKR